MVLGGPRSDSVPVRWNQVVAMLDPYPYPYPYPAIGREMRSLAPAAEAETCQLPLIKEIILAYAGRPDPSGEETVAAYTAKRH